MGLLRVLCIWSIFPFHNYVVSAHLFSSIIWRFPLFNWSDTRSEHGSQYKSWLLTRVPKCLNWSFLFIKLLIWWHSDYTLLYYENNFTNRLSRSGGTQGLVQAIQNQSYITDNLLIPVLEVFLLIKNILLIKSRGNRKKKWFMTFT